MINVPAGSGPKGTSEAVPPSPIEAGAGNDPLIDLAGYPGAGRVGRLNASESARARDLSRHLPPALYAVILAWLAYLLITPWLWSAIGPLALLAVPTAGLFLFSWLGYYLHELWHNYFPGINNRYWYNVVSYLLFADPQVYRAAHASHHKFVHTVDDLEFFCEDWLTDRKKRRRQFYAELLFGTAAWQAEASGRLLKAGKITQSAAFASICVRLAIVVAWFGMLWLFAPGLIVYTFLVWIATAWLGALLARHNQWVEHLGILSRGDIIERNALTRNLAPSGLASRLFILYTHADPAEHIYHHTDGRVATRNLGFGLQPDATTITLGQYFRLLRDYGRSL